jgi:hypothetical protein
MNEAAIARQEEPPCVSPHAARGLTTEDREITERRGLRELPSAAEAGFILSSKGTARAVSAIV